MNSGKISVNRSVFESIDWIIAILAFLFSFSIYVSTLTPSLSSLSPDGSELATVPAILNLVHMPCQAPNFCTTHK